ncbi:hypothetical protein CH330_04455 [candidate division WOR-3 bacterium JGI_Cruoil_03_51_56]|uniref:Uncharacterized protein n=1 Tax=candidate division WOR-3 bacterium JGI_Cruoil_03_51_56 TaxID=1973747 RepID=A0A235BWD3_UNCW3|nr:MAG: hypothetical protein CH330_04455 [candidate division WOR-3 bacterium JGI_Cruoil_03_51_56]
MKRETLCHAQADTACRIATGAVRNDRQPLSADRIPLTAFRKPLTADGRKSGNSVAALQISRTLRFCFLCPSMSICGSQSAFCILHS